MWERVSIDKKSAVSQKKAALLVVVVSCLHMEIGLSLKRLDACVFEKVIDPK